MARHPCGSSRPLRAALAALSILAALAAASCSSRLGWGLVIWTDPEVALPAGTIVPVYIKSTIEGVYVVGVPSGVDKGKKVELKLWQLELFRTRGQAAARAKAFGPAMSLYMVATRNGVPLREEPDSAAKSVFRLREGQSVKVIERVQGGAVTTGGQDLGGAWYKVLADDGTYGYAYSYAFRVYDETKEGPPMVAKAKTALSGRVDLLFSRSWRPEYFQEMLEDGRLDLDYFSLRFGLFIDSTKKQIRLELPGASQVFNYSDISEAAGLYSFAGTPLKVRIESDSRILCSWSGSPLPPLAESEGATSDSDDAEASSVPAAGSTAASSPAPAKALATDAARVGSGGQAYFVVLDANLGEAIRLEGVRRQQLLGAFIEENGAAWTAAADSPGAGRLDLVRNGRFTWRGREAGVPAFLPAGSGESGEVAFRLFLDPSLQGTWTGTLSLRFDKTDQSSKGAPAWIDLLYRRGPTGLVLAPAAKGQIGLVVSATDPRAHPLVLEPVSE